METLVHEHQEEYYDVLGRADRSGDSTPFVEFMLKMIRDALKEIHDNENGNVATNVAVNVVTNEEKVLALLRQDGRLTAKVLASTLGLTERQVERIVASLKKQGVLIRHGASKNGFWEVVDMT